MEERNQKLFWSWVQPTWKKWWRVMSNQLEVVLMLTVIITQVVIVLSKEGQLT